MGRRSPNNGGQDRTRTKTAIKDELGKIVQELKARIPVWIPLIPDLYISTQHFGIIWKSCHLAEQIFKDVALLAQCYGATGDTQLPPLSGRLTLGDVCRHIKGEQKESAVFRGVDPILIGRIFNQLDTIVSLRNEFIHMGRPVVNLIELPEAEQLKWGEKIHDLLNSVYELCDSWLIKKLMEH